MQSACLCFILAALVILVVLNLWYLMLVIEDTVFGVACIRMFGLLCAWDASMILPTVN